MWILDKERSHLTAADRQAIAAMRANGWTRAHSKRKRYGLEPAADRAGVFLLTVRHSERDDFGRPVERVRRTLIAF